MFATSLPRCRIIRCAMKLSLTRSISKTIQACHSPCRVTWLATRPPHEALEKDQRPQLSQSLSSYGHSQLTNTLLSAGMKK